MKKYEENMKKYMGNMKIRTLRIWAVKLGKILNSSSDLGRGGWLFVIFSFRGTPKKT